MCQEECCLFIYLMPLPIYSLPSSYTLEGFTFIPVLTFLPCILSFPHSPFFSLMHSNTVLLFHPPSPPYSRTHSLLSPSLASFLGLNHPKRLCLILSITTHSIPSSLLSTCIPHLYISPLLLRPLLHPVFL